jgi:hypothetical protein
MINILFSVCQWYFFVLVALMVFIHKL